MRAVYQQIGYGFGKRCVTNRLMPVIGGNGPVTTVLTKKVVPERGITIRPACLIFLVSETCYRYDAKRDAKNDRVADWLNRLTDNYRSLKKICVNADWLITLNKPWFK